MIRKYTLPMMVTLFAFSPLLSRAAFADVASLHCAASSLFYGATDVTSTPLQGIDVTFAATAVEKVEFNSDSHAFATQPRFGVILHDGNIQIFVDNPAITATPAITKNKIVAGQEVSLELGGQESATHKSFLVTCIIK